MQKTVSKMRGYPQTAKCSVPVAVAGSGEQVLEPTGLEVGCCAHGRVSPLWQEQLHGS